MRHSIERSSESPDIITLNMGPSHPATHGVLRLVVQLDGEQVLRTVPHLGYLHRGMEKIAYNRTYTQFIPYTDRQDYLAPLANNVGFALIGLAAGGPIGASSVLFYMAVYVAMTLGSFLVVLRMRDENGPIESLDSLKGLSQTRPWLAAGLAMFMFSLAGIPPLFGFWPKLLVFWAAVDAGLIALAVAGIIGTVIGAYYYIKIVKLMYFDAPSDPYSRVRAPVETAFIVLAALVVSPLGYLLIGPLGRVADNAAASLF